MEDQEDAKEEELPTDAWTQGQVPSVRVHSPDIQNTTRSAFYE